jgi:hypothetical protein
VLVDYRRMTITTTPSHQQLAVAAFVCALLVPPLGLALGAVARGEAQASGYPVPGLATAAIAVGAALSALLVIGLLLVVGAVALLVFAYYGLASDFG